MNEMMNGVIFFGIVKPVIGKTGELYGVTESVDRTTKEIDKHVIKLDGIDPNSITIKDNTYAYVNGYITMEETEEKHKLSKFNLTTLRTFTSQFPNNSSRLRFIGITKLNYEMYKEQANYKTQKLYTDHGVFIRIAPSTVKISQYAKYEGKNIIVSGTLVSSVLNNKIVSECKTSKIVLLYDETLYTNVDMPQTNAMPEPQLQPQNNVEQNVEPTQNVEPDMTTNTNANADIYDDII